MKKWLIIFGVIALAIVSVLVYKGGTNKDLVFEQSDTGINYQDDSGSLKVEYLDNPSFDVSTYPGSRALADNSLASVNIGGRKFVVGSYLTTDKVEDVINYYLSNIPQAKTGNITDFEGENATIIYSDNSQTSIMVKESGSQTQIVLIKA